ncbi:MAG: hypothetical protein A2879_00805 [Omnitrophica WOR_2 bacterium RIFCSPHIGHO2_01_FULL_49_10]|nr:MAG: hypothetical protein A2879_00805 [Omnitrophica WOR_2 bacterium RIFCSPHIGHO2_01_FULL_49_10]
MDLESQIITAIREKRQMKINYKGYGDRIVCPHVLYFSSAGNKLVHTYQISGYSEHPQQIPGWRPFQLSEITDFSILDEKFEVAPGYNPSNRDKYSTIIENI